MTWDRYADAVPTPGFFIGVATGFLLGVTTALLLDCIRSTPTSSPSRDTEDTMNERPLGMVWLESRPRLHALYFRYVPALVVLMVLSVIFSVAGVTWLTFQRGEDQRSRTADNAAFIKCLDTYTTALAGSLPPVRVATARRDAALSAALGAKGLQGALSKIAKKSFEPADLAALIGALAAYDAADQALSDARAENPYPPPPSKLCKLP